MVLWIFVLKALGILTCIISDFNSAYDADETCVQMNAGMFLQTGQSCWWCMARIRSICIDGTCR